MNGKEVEDGEQFSVVLQRFHYLSIQDFLDLSLEEVEKNGKGTEVATQAPNVLEEYLNSHELIKLDGEPRLIIRQ